MALAEHCASDTAIPWRTIPAMLADNLVRHARRCAIVDGDVRISYEELGQRLQAVAAGLRERNLGPGDRVALWAPNSWQWVISAAACWWCGCTVVPIPARGRILDALPILQVTRARLLFTCSAASSGNLPALMRNHLRENASRLRDLCPELDTVVDFSDGEELPGLPVVGMARFAGDGRRTPPVPPAEIAGDAFCTLLFTSGSTGRPKGVPRRHDQSLRSRWASSLDRACSPDDRFLVVSEFSHSLGLNSNLLCSLLLGSTLVITHSKHPGDIALLIRAEGITHIAAPPSLFAGLLRERIDGEPACATLRLALTAATNIPPALVRELIATGVDAVVSSYGMTECDIIATTVLDDGAEAIATTVGRPLPGVDVRITDENGTTVPAGAAGEIRVRGYPMACWYLGADGAFEPSVDADGWLHTGDVGSFTAQGYLRILGRRKDAMTIHGYTLYPAEVEALLSRSGLLKEVAVMGLPHALAGEICVAFIVPAQPPTFSLNVLRLWARRNMADYKIPGRFVLLEQLPLNRSGKVDRLMLRSSLDA